MKEVKCQWCNKKDNKEIMICEEKGTDKCNKNGTEKKVRKYYHDSCFIEYQKDKQFKEQETKELDELYRYLLNLHNVKVLDARMMEKIQDLRNGTIKVNNKKIKRYKEGVP